MKAGLGFENIFLQLLKATATNFYELAEERNKSNEGRFLMINLSAEAFGSDETLLGSVLCKVGFY